MYLVSPWKWLFYFLIKSLNFFYNKFWWRFYNKVLPLYNFTIKISARIDTFLFILFYCCLFTSIYQKDPSYFFTLCNRSIYTHSTNLDCRFLWRLGDNNWKCNWNNCNTLIYVFGTQMIGMLSYGYFSFRCDEF